MSELHEDSVYLLGVLEYSHEKITVCAPALCVLDDLVIDRDFGIGEDLTCCHVIAEMPTETSVKYSLYTQTFP